MQTQFKIGDKVIITKNGKMFGVPIGTVLTVTGLGTDFIMSKEKFPYANMNVNLIWNDQIELIDERQRTHMPEWF